MSPVVKYTLGRIGLFVAAFLAVLPVPFSIFLKLAVALLVSSLLSWFVLRGWREQYSLQLQKAMERRKEEKRKLRSALAGEDDEAGSPSSPSARAGAGADEPDDPTDAASPSRTESQ